MELIAERIAVVSGVLRNAVRMLATDSVLAAKRFILPTSYWRLSEFAFVWKWIAAPHGARVLDLGSPKEFATTLAAQRTYAMTCCDIMPEEVAAANRYARALRRTGSGPGQVRAQQEDGRSLSFPDNSFDAAFSVSVIEHIPGDGDSLAARELIRVVKPGGRIVITVPADSAYRETHVTHNVYEREHTGAPVFYERHYDDAALTDRLVRPSGAVEIAREFWGENSLHVERMLDRLGKLRTPLSPMEPLLSTLFLAPVKRNGVAPKAAFLVLKSPENKT